MAGTPRMRMPMSLTVPSDESMRSQMACGKKWLKASMVRTACSLFLRSPGRTPARRPLGSMSSRHSGDLVWRFRRRLAAPDHVHVGPQQDQVVAVDFARNLVVHVEHLEGSAVR